MNLFTRDQLTELQTVRLFPSLSFYLPVQKEGADTRQGPIRLRKMAKATEEALHNKGVRTPIIEQIIKPVQDLYDDALFWEHQEATLALFFNENGLRVFQLPIQVPESVTISDRFTVRPLLRMIDHDGHYNMLQLSLGDARLFRCTRYHMKEIKLSDQPDSLKAVFDTYSVEKQLQHHAGSAQGRNSAGGSVFHGSESMKDSEKDRINEYFRLVDTHLKKVLSEDAAPLVLACVDYLYPLFKAASRDQRLMENHISGSPDTLKRDAILACGWDIVRPFFLKEKTAALKNCQKLLGTSRVIEDIRQILPAAVNRQIDYLFLRDDVQSWGQFDPVNGKVILSKPNLQAEFGAEELLDQAAELVMQNGGQVFVLTAEEMPDQADCLATIRYEASFV